MSVYNLAEYFPTDPLKQEVLAYKYKTHLSKPFGATAFKGTYEELLGKHTVDSNREAHGGLGFFTLKNGIDANYSRENEDIDRITALVYDFDDVKDTVRDVLVDTLKKRKIAFIYYTTFKHRKNPGLCRFRIVLPLVKHYEATWHEYVYEGVFKEIWGDLNLNKKDAGMDSSCKNAARFFFALVCPQETEHEAVIKGYPGNLFDVHKYLLINNDRHNTMKTMVVRKYHFYKNKEKVHADIRALNADAPEPLDEDEVQKLLDWADEKFIDVVIEEDNKNKNKLVLLDEFLSNKEIFLNERIETMYVNGEEVSDALLTAVRLEFAKLYNKGVDENRDIRKLIKVRAQANKRDFFKEYLAEIEAEAPWDGVDYAGQWFNYENRDPIEDSYFKRFGVALIARQFEPNIDVQIQFTLLGDPNIGKSEVFKILTFKRPEWIADVASMKVDRDTYHEMQECVIAVVEEFDRVTNTHRDAAQTKHEQTSHQSRITLKYDAFATKIMKRHVLAATTNRPEFLKDTTGNRRNLVLKLEDKQPSLEWWTNNTRNLYRQWMHLYRSGYKFTLTKEEADKVTAINREHLFLTEFQMDIEDAIDSNRITLGMHKEDILNLMRSGKFQRGEVAQLNSILHMHDMYYSRSWCETHKTKCRIVQSRKNRPN